MLGVQAFPPDPASGEAAAQFQDTVPAAQSHWPSQIWFPGEHLPPWTRYKHKFSHIFMYQPRSLKEMRELPSRSCGQSKVDSLMYQPLPLRNKQNRRSPERHAPEHRVHFGESSTTECSLLQLNPHFNLEKTIPSHSQAQESQSGVMDTGSNSSSSSY